MHPQQWRHLVRTQLCFIQSCESLLWSRAWCFSWASPVSCPPGNRMRFPAVLPPAISTLPLSLQALISPFTPGQPACAAVHSQL